MSDNIWSNRFFNKGTEPAWHKKGIVREVDWTAAQTLESIGSYEIVKEPLYLRSDGGYEESKLYLIRRAPTKDDPVWRTFGEPVTESYEPNSPIMTARTWDENVCGEDGKPVAIETMGILGKGERLFITTKLPTIDVKGDQIDNYLIFDSPYETGIAYSVNVANIRVVCQNTLRAALAQASQRHAIQHTTGASEFLAEWLRSIYANALAATKIMEESYTALAETKVKLPQVKWIIDHTYRMPKKPQPTDMARKDIEERLRIFESDAALVKRLRETALECYKGAGDGADTVAAKGTAWGAWNAITQLESYRRGSEEKTAEQLLIGDRATRMQNAFLLAQNVDHYQTVDLRSLGMRRVRA